MVKLLQSPKQVWTAHDFAALVMKADWNLSHEFVTGGEDRSEVWDTYEPAKGERVGS